MADDMNLTLRLEAVDEASPKLRKVKNEIDAIKASLDKLEPGRLQRLFAVPDDTLQAVRRAFDPITSLKEKAARRERADIERTAATKATAAKAERADASAATKLRSNLAKAQDRAVADSFRTFKAAQRIKTTTLRNEKREADGVARAERDRVADQVKRDRDVFAMRARWRRAEAAEQRRVDREAEKAEKSSARRRAALASAGRDLGGNVITTASRAGLIVSAGALIGARRILGVETDADAAELDLRAASGMDAKQARDLRTGWATSAAESYGASAADMMRSFTEATKVGIPTEGAKQFTEATRQAAEAWQLPGEMVTDALGTLNALQTANGEAFDGAKFKGVANSVTALADKMATTPEKMLSFMARGAGASQVLGMSQDLGLAIGAASTSLGNEAGQSGRMFDFLAGRAIDMPRLTRKRGEEGDRARAMVNALGFGSGADLDRRRRASPDDFMFDIIDRFAHIRDPKKRDAAMQFFTGREWFGEFGRLVTGNATVKEAKRIALEARNADALGARWKLHTQKLAFLAKQITAGVSNIVGDFGMAAAPIARDLGDGVLRWLAEARAGGIGEAFSRGLDGLMEGMIGRPLKAALDAMHVNKINPDAFVATARGFGAGLRTVGETVVAVAGAISTVATAFGSTGAKLAAELLGFGVVAFMLRPVVGIMSSFAQVLAAVVEIATPARLGLAVAGLGRFAGVIGSVATVVAAGGLLRLTGALGGLLALAMAADKAGVGHGDFGKARMFSWEGMVRMLDPGLANRIFGQPQKEDGTRPESPGWFWMFRKKTAYEGGGPERGLLHDAAYREFTDPVREMSASFKDLSAKLILASYGPAGTASAAMGTSFGMSAGSSGGGGGGSGGGPVNTFGLGRRGIIGGGGSAGGNNYGTPSKSLLDFIAKSEGADYNVSWGNGKFLPGGKEQNLTGKSLNEILQLGKYMRHQPGAKNSSAMGRYQITGSTIRDLMGRMHLTGNELFDQKMQDAMASKLIQDEGPRALQRWKSLKSGGRMATAMGLYKSGQIAPMPNVAGAGPITDEATGDFRGLPIKSGEAMAGGTSSKGIVDMARSLMTAAVPGRLDRFTAFNDLYHRRANPNSLHTKGLAADFTIKDPTKSADAAEKVRQMFRAAGIADGMFKVIDEYRNPSSHATGGHIHYQLNSPEAAKAYAEATEANKKQVADIASSVAPPPASRGPQAAADAGGHAGKGTTYVTQHIHGGTNDPEALANKVQRRVREQSRSWTIDVESI